MQDFSNLMFFCLERDTKKKLYIWWRHDLYILNNSFLSSSWENNFIFWMVYSVWTLLPSLDKIFSNEMKNKKFLKYSKFLFELRGKMLHMFRSTRVFGSICDNKIFQSPPKYVESHVFWINIFISIRVRKLSFWT